MTANFIKDGLLQKYFWGALALLLFCYQPAQAQSRAPVKLSALQQKVLSAPLQKPYKWYASTDAKKQNNDYLVLAPHQTRKITLSAGAIKRVWSTASEPAKFTLSIEDGKNTVLLKDGKAQQGTFLHKAYSFYPESTFQTISDNAKLVATNDSDKPNKFFYQVSVRPAPPVQAPQFSGNEVLINVQKNLKPGKIMKLGKAGQFQGGMIRQIQISQTAKKPIPLNQLILEISTSPKNTLVKVPLSAFMGAFAQPPHGKTGLAAWDGKTLTINWPMSTSLNSELTLTIRNSGQASGMVKSHISFLQMNNPSPFLFCARQGSANSADGKPFTLATINGAGALVGLGASMGVAPKSPRRTFAFLEGNEIIKADANTYEGTGTEDFFNSAWYFPNTTFLQPFAALTAHQKMPPRVAAARWMVDDAIAFRNHLKMTLGHGGSNTGSGLQYHWDVFWYQKLPLHVDIPATVQQTSSQAEQPKSVNGLVAALRILIYTLFFVFMLFIILVALAKYAQKN